jgi:hypothetical protein
MSDRSIALVYWNDAFAMGEHSWQPVDELEDEPREIMSVGIILPGVCKNHLVLTQSLDVTGDTVDHTLAIPHAMIKSVTILNAGISLPLEKLT